MSIAPPARGVKASMRQLLCVGLATLVLLVFQPLAAQKGAPQVLPTGLPARTLHLSPGPVQLRQAEDEATLVDLLRQRLPALQHPGVALRTLTTSTNPWLRIRRYVQTYAGYAVAGAEVSVALDGQGRVLQVLESTADPTGAVLPTTIARVSWQGWLLERLDTLWQVSADGRWQLQIQAQVTEPLTGRPRTLHVDAASGALLATSDPAVYRRPAPPDTSGRALLFRPDPLTTAGVAYGATPDFRHNGGATNPSLNAQRRLVTLRDIRFAAGQFVLEGPHVRLRDLAPPTSPIASSATADFSADRSQTRFTDAMAYFYIDSLQRYVQALGFSALRGTQGILVDPRGDPDDLSYFVGGTDPFINLGVGGVPDAEDADVIVHEYGHALSFWAAPNTNNGNERRGFDEGWCDYLAASFSAGISPFGSDQVFNWDGHNEFWPGRPATSTAVYDSAAAPSTNLYALASVWCGALMAIRARLGQAVTDRAHLSALSLSASGMTLRQAARNLILADSLISGLQHRSVLDSIFCARGLRPGCRGPAPPVVEPPPSDSCTLRAWAIVDRILRIEIDPPASPRRWRLTDLGGRTVASGELYAASADVDVSSLAPGLYVLTVSCGAAEARARIPIMR